MKPRVLRLAVFASWSLSGSSVEALVDELDRSDVLAAVPEHPAKRVVEIVDVAVAQTACVTDDPAELEGHFGHEAEGAAARGLCEQKIVWLKTRERVGGKAFCAKLDLDRLDEVAAELPEIPWGSERRSRCKSMNRSG